MRHKRLKLCAVFLLGLGLTGLQAQESVSATGGNVSGSGGSVSYSVGQVAYQTYTGSNGSVAEGIQQPYEIFTITSIEDAKGIKLSVFAYPNPTTDYLTLSITDMVKTNHDLSLLSYQLYNIHGRLLKNEKVTSNQTSIFMGNLAPSTYFVKVVVKAQGLTSQEVKSFKIVKR